jgi:hypothetical protein
MMCPNLIYNEDRRQLRRMVMEEELIAEVETQLTYDLFRDFYGFSLFKGKFHRIAPWVFYGVVFLGTFIDILAIRNYGFTSILVYMLLFLAVLGVFVTRLIFFVPRKRYQGIKDFVTEPNKYRFTDNTLYVESSSGTSVLRYGALHKVYELDEVLYIFISSAQVFIVEKKGFSQESLQSLREALRYKLGEKYRNYGGN